MRRILLSSALLLASPLGVLAAGAPITVTAMPVGKATGREVSIP